MMALACESSAYHAVPVYHSYQTHCSQPESVAVLTSESVLEQQALVLRFAGISEQPQELASAAELGLVVSLVGVSVLGRGSPGLSAMWQVQPLQRWHQLVALVIVVALVILT